MSCSGAFDIYEGKTYSECPSTEVCKYDYSYEYDRTSKCRVTKKSNYLKLLCWDRSNVTIANMKNLRLTEARLYSPSVNKWEGLNVPAELILSHTGSGKSVDVCIPIIKDDSSGDASIKFFDAIHNAVRILPNERNGTMRSVELPANFSLNNIIPKASFYLAEGDGMAINKCSTSMRNIIIFSKERAMKMKTKVHRDIRNLIQVYNPGVNRKIEGSGSAHPRTGEGKFWKNTGGTTKSNNNSEFSAAGQMAMECEPVNNSNTGNNVGIKKNPTVDAADKFSGMNGKEIFMKYGLPVIYFISTILGLFIFYKIFFVFPYPHFRVKDNAKGKKVNRVMYAIGHIPGLGKMIVGKGGLARMKGGIEEED